MLFFEDCYLGRSLNIIFKTFKKIDIKGFFIKLNSRFNVIANHSFDAIMKYLYRILLKTIPELCCMYVHACVFVCVCVWVCVKTR